MNRLIVISTLIFMLSADCIFAQKFHTYDQFSFSARENVYGPNSIGSPYLTNEFLKVKIGNNPNKILIRYDAYVDLVEVLVDQNVYHLPKEDEFSFFTFDRVYSPLIYIKNPENEGYFFRVLDGKNQLLKKEKTTLHIEKQSILPNSMIKESSTKFEKQPPTYYIKTENKMLGIPKSTKELVQEFPEIKNELENFIKTNKIRLKDEQSLVKIVKFLNTF